MSGDSAEVISSSAMDSGYSSLESWKKWKYAVFLGETLFNLTVPLSTLEYEWLTVSSEGRQISHTIQGQ